MKPVVDGLEKEMGAKLIIIRVDIHSAAGRALTGPMGFEYTPTFIFFGPDGAELWRQVGSLDLDRVRQSVGG